MGTLPGATTKPLPNLDWAGLGVTCSLGWGGGGAAMDLWVVMGLWAEQ